MRRCARDWNRLVYGGALLQTAFPPMALTARPDSIHASRDEIRRLANEFEQSAFFWFDGSAFWLVDATDDSYEIRLPPDER